MVSFKRKRIDGRKEKPGNVTEDKLGEKDIDLEMVKRFTENQRVLHRYRGDEDLSSLWGDHFQLSMVANEYCQNPADVKPIQEVGDMGVAQYLQVIGARLVSIGRTQELKHARDSFDKASMDQLMQDNLEKGNKLCTALDLVYSLQEKLTAVEDVGKKIGEEKTALEARLIVLGVEKKHLETRKEDHGLEMFAAGFERAVEQAKFLVPTVDLSVIDPCKVIVDNELVDDHDSVEGEVKTLMFSF